MSYSITKLQMETGHKPSLFKNWNTDIYPDQAADAVNSYLLTLIDRLNLKIGHVE